MLKSKLFEEGMQKLKLTSAHEVKTMDKKNIPHEDCLKAIKQRREEALRIYTETGKLALASKKTGVNAFDILDLAKSKKT